jgi:hypothetical protein
MNKNTSRFFSASFTLKGKVSTIKKIMNKPISTGVTVSPAIMTMLPPLSFVLHRLSDRELGIGTFFPY